jgi:hypothetical protein
MAQGSHYPRLLITVAPTKTRMSLAVLLLLAGLARARIYTVEFDWPRKPRPRVEDLSRAGRAESPPRAWQVKAMDWRIYLIPRVSALTTPRVWPST